MPHDPLANFLFERKQGHCEYFASSMAVMLRSLGIPARLVNGFRTGEFNDLTSQYVVRASNAHSWVEVFFPGYGWIAFDPTPGASIQVRTGWSRIGLYMDAMASFWRDWVVNYDAGHQQAWRWAQAPEPAIFWRCGIGGAATIESMLAAARRVSERVAGSPLRWGLGGIADRGVAPAGRERAAALADPGPSPAGRASGEVATAGSHDLVRTHDRDRQPARLAEVADSNARRICESDRRCQGSRKGSRNLPGTMKAPASMIRWRTSASAGVV